VGRFGPESRKGELKMVSASFARLPRWTAALASGDLDGDGRDEVVALTDDELIAFSPDGRVLARRELRFLPRSSSPSREPVGAVAVLPSPPRVAWLSAQRARGEELALEPGGGFRVLRQIDQAPLSRVGGAALSARLVPGQNTFQDVLKVDGRPPVELKLPRGPVTVSASSGPSGPAVVAVYADGKGSLLRGLSGDAPRTPLDGLGAATALVDVDGDGLPELVTTEAAWSPSAESLRILSLPGAGAPDTAAPELLKIGIPRGRALQLTGADLDGDGTCEILVALWLPDGTTDLQVFRRVSR
jgi:hypothetical protein